MGVVAVGSLRVSEWWSGQMVRLVALACVVVAGVLTAGGLVEAAPTVERWSGADRYSTSVRVSKEAFPSGADVVFVATGESFPDALAAGPAAATLDAPILLTATNELPAVVSAELQRLAPSTVYLLGGNAAITANVESQVGAATSAEVERIAGTDRYSTAAAVTELAFPTADTVYVAAGTGFADALSAGAPGGVRGRPVLLTASGAVPVASRGQITRLGDPDIIVLGGNAAISNAVLAELDSLTTGSVKRVSGSDRYATSVAVSVDAFNKADTVFLATGTAFPDALSAAPAATGLNAPILLTKPACAPAEVIAEVNRLGATNVIALGGTNAISNKAANLTPCPAAGARLALDVLASIPVENERSDGYDRSLFAYGDTADAQGCRTRALVLKRDSLTPAQVDPVGCTVVAGDWLSVYDGVAWSDPAELEVDHVVALKEAWDSGAWQWTAAKRSAFGNDLTDERSLRAVTGSVNQSKSASDPSNWLPPDSSFTCTYLSDWVSIKARWGLSMDQSEHGRIRNLLTDRCPGQAIKQWSAPPTAGPSPPSGACDPSYPDVCIPTPPPDLDCGDISFRRFRVLPPDPHRFDSDNDGVGCES